MQEFYQIESSQTVQSSEKSVGTDTLSEGQVIIASPPPKPENAKKPTSNRLAIFVSLFALYVIWGSTYLAMRIGLDGFPPFMMAGVRFLVAAAILYPILRWRGVPAPTKKQWLGAGVVGILLLAGGNGGVAFSEQWVASGLASVGIAAVPLWTALFMGLWGRWPTRVEWLGLGLGFVGVILLNLGNGVWANPIGAVSLLLAPICWALGSAWSRHITLPAGLMSSAAEMVAGGVVLVLVSFALRERTPDLHVTQSLWAIAFLVIFGSLVAFSAYGYLLRTVRPSLATSYAYVNPMVAVGLGVIVDGEHITMLGLLAMLIILAGVALVSLGRDRK
jgi:drug/metabolite transporter (DMT)-like permease